MQITIFKRHRHKYLSGFCARNLWTPADGTLDLTVRENPWTHVEMGISGSAWGNANTCTYLY